MELYHFTTTRGFENIESQGRLYLMSPNTELDKKANGSVNLPPNVRYISFSESDSFASGYPASKEDYGGSKCQYRIGIDVEDLKKQGELVGPVDYIGQMDKEYIHTHWNSGYIKFLRKKGVIGKDETVDERAKKNLNEREYRFVSNKPYIDLKKCKVSVVAKEGGAFTPRWKDIPSKDIEITSAAMGNVAEIIATILLADVSPTRTGASPVEEKDLTSQIQTLETDKEELEIAANQEKSSYKTKHDPVKAYIRAVRNLMSDYSWFLSWFEDKRFQDPSLSAIVRDKIRETKKEDLVKRYEKILNRLEKDRKDLSTKLLDIDKNRNKALADIDKQIAELDKQRQHSFESDEAAQKIRERIGKYVSAANLKFITTEAVKLLGQFEEEGKKGVFSKLDRSYKFLVGIENKLPNKELLLAVEDWVIEAYKEYGDDYGSYEKLRAAKSQMLEQKDSIKGLLPLIDKSLKDTLGTRFIKEASSGTPIAPSVGISSEKRGKLSDLYAQLRDQLGMDFNVQFNNTCIVIRPKYSVEMTNMTYDKERLYESEEESVENPEEEFNYIPYMASYCKFMQTEGRKIQPLPEIILNKEKQSDGLLSMKTGHYDPSDKVLTVYTRDRNPKDVMRSFAHEMEHHVQCLEGKLTNIQSEQVVDDKHLEEIEAEAYKNGNISFRKWTETNK